MTRCLDEGGGTLVTRYLDEGGGTLVTRYLDEGGYISDSIFG